MSRLSIFLYPFYALLIVLACVLMFLAARDYWGLIDVLVYPVSYRAGLSTIDLIENGQLTGLYFNLQETILPYTQDLAIFVIDLIGWEFDLYIAILFVAVLCLICLFIMQSKHKKFHTVMLSVCLLSLLTGILFSKDHASRSEVVEVFGDFKHRPVIDADLLILLKTKQFDELDRILQDLHKQFKQGEIDTYEFAYHYDTLDVYLDKDDIGLLNEWLDLSDNKKFAYLLRGSLYTRLGSDARGGRYYKDTPKDQLVAMQKYYDLASSDLEKVIAADPFVVIAYRHLYLIAGTGDYKIGHRKVYNNATDVFGHNYMLAYYAAHHLQSKWGGTHDEIFRFGRTLRDSSNHDPRLIGISGLQLAYDAYKLNKEERYDESATLHKLILLYAPRETIFYNLGLMYSAQGDHESVLDLMGKCISYRADARFCLGLEMKAHNTLKNYRQAEIPARKIAKLGLLPVWVTNNAGYTFEQVFDYELAQEMYIRTLKRDPLDMYALSRLYRMSASNETNDELILPFFQTAAEESEDSAEAWMLYADMLRDSKPKQALPVFERYLSVVNHNDDSEVVQKQIKYAETAIAEIIKKLEKNRGPTE